MPEGGRAPATRWALALSVGLHLALAALLGRGALGEERLAGAALGEGWGRVFVLVQVRRWLTGQAPPGRADLLFWPEGMPFWPVDPAHALLGALLGALVGDVRAFALLMVLSSALAGLGVALFARQLGARPAAALLAGGVAQLSPMMLAQGSDAVLEATALGPLALGLAALVRAGRRPEGGRALLALAGLVCAATSPYFALYLGLAALPALLLLRVSARRAAGLLLALGLGLGLPALPLLASERGDGGRLSETFRERGYDLSPGERVLAESGRPLPRVRPTVGVHEHRAPPPDGGRPRPPPRLQQLVQRSPGGLALLLCALLGLGSRRARPLAMLALLVLLLSPEPWTLARFLDPGVPRRPGLLAEALGLVPGLSTLGNSSRLLGLWVVLAASALALLPRPLLPLLGLVALFEAHTRLPALALPSAALPACRDLAVPAAPTVIFPSGDPPTWHPQVGPKEALLLAARWGTPVASDFGRARPTADRAALVRLARIADAPIARAALEGVPALPDEEAAWAALPFAQLVVLEDRLGPAELRRLRAWLGAHAEPRGRVAGCSLWAWPRRFGEGPAGSGGSDEPAQEGAEDGDEVQRVGEDRAVPPGDGLHQGPR